MNFGARWASTMRLEPASRYVAAAMLSGVPVVSLGIPDTCADVKAKIEQRLAAKGVVEPPLKIVPRGLAGGSRVLGSCEGGTQRIIQRPAPAASGLGIGRGAGQPGKI